MLSLLIRVKISLEYWKDFWKLSIEARQIVKVGLWLWTYSKEQFNKEPESRKLN